MKTLKRFGEDPLPIRGRLISVQSTFIEMDDSVDSRTVDKSLTNFVRADAMFVIRSADIAGEREKPIIGYARSSGLLQDAESVSFRSAEKKHWLFWPWRYS